MRFYRSIVDWPKTALVIILLLTALFAGFASKIKVDNSIEALFLESDPTLQYFRQFTDLFGSSEIAALAFTDAKGVVNKVDLHMIDTITRRVEAEVPYVLQVVSLSNANLIHGTENGIVIEPFLTDIPEDGSPEMVTLATRAMGEPLFRRTLISDDGKTSSIIVKTEYRKGDDLYRAEITAKLRAIVAEESAKAGAEFHLGGPPIFLTVFNEYIVSDLMTFGPVTAIVLLLLLFITFRHWNGIVLPMLTVLIGLIWTFGFMALIDKKINLATTIIPPLIAVIGVANVIHFINIYTHEISLGKERYKAVLDTLSHLGSPMFVSSLTTVVGFASLMISDISVIRETGLVSGFGVLATMLISLVIPPILLLWSQPSKAMVEQYEKTVSSGFLGRFLDTIQNGNERHPWAVICTGLVISLFFGYGITMINVETNFVKYFHEDSEIVQSQNFIQQHLSGVAPLEVLVDAGENGTIKSPAILKEMDQIEKQLQAEPLVDHVFSPVDYVKILRQAFYQGDSSYYTLPDDLQQISQLFLVYDLQGGGAGLEDFRTGDYRYGRISARLQDAGTKELREVIARTEELFGKTTSGAKYNFADNTNLIVNIVDNLIISQAESLAMALVLIAFMMAWFLKGLRLGLMAMVPNVFPIVIVLGTMGYLGIDLNVSTVMVPAIAIGLAVDDTVHLFSRFAQQRGRFPDNISAARETIHTTGRACIFTSVNLCAGFMVLGLSNFYPNLYFGVLSSITVAAAVTADLTITMALLRLAGPSTTR